MVGKLSVLKQFLYRLTHEVDSWTFYMAQMSLKKGIKDCEEVYKKCLTLDKISKITVNIDETRREPEVIIEYVLEDGEIKVLDMYSSNVLKINKNIDKPIINLKSKFRVEIDKYDRQMWSEWRYSTEIILPENYKDALYGRSYEIVCDLEG